jgi:hypothetical protein
MDDEQGADGQGSDMPGGATPNTGPRERATPADTPTRAPRKSRLGLKLVGLFVLIPALLFAAWTAITLNWAYSEGDRAGYIQKFSQKGWLCKTWEGEIAQQSMPGSAPQLFPFTVKDDSVAHAITAMMGSRVALHYKEHRGVPGSCFGDTQYYVTSVKVVAGP